MTEARRAADSRTARLSPHKVVLPADLLKDLVGTEAEQCLDSESFDGFYYFPDFINEAEEEQLMSKIASAPLPKWRALQARRLQNWGGQLSKQILIPEQLPDFLTTFPPLIQRIRETGAYDGSKHGEPNHCLVNEYEPGQGIMPHEDGSAYFPAVATVSLGGHTVLDIYRYADGGEAKEAEQTGQATTRAREQDPRFAIVQERRSLLITCGAAYKYFLHGIAERHSDEGKHLASATNGDMLGEGGMRELVSQAKAGKQLEPLARRLRVSLTLRDVERVAPKNLISSMLGRR